MLILKSQDVWSKVEQTIQEIKLRNDLDSILTNRLESLINHYNGNIARNNEYTCIGYLRDLQESLSRDSFYTIRNIDKGAKESLKKLASDIELLVKVLIKESADKTIEEVAVKDRLPNIGIEKSLNLFNDKEVIYE